MDKLINDAQSGNAEVLLSLIEQFDRLIKKYARRLNYEDAYYDIRLELIRVIMEMRNDRMNSTNDGAFVVYINKTLYHHYIKLSRRRQSLSLETPFSEFSEEALYMIEQDTSTTDGYFSDDFESMKHLLTEKEFLIINQLYQEQMTISEIAKRSGVTRQAINKTKNRALNKLRKII